MSTPTAVAPEATQTPAGGRGGPRWLTATELHSYLKDNYGVSLFQLKGSHSTFQAFARKVGVRRREFKFATLPPKAQQARVEFIEQSPSKLHQSVAALKRCQYEFNVSDVRKLVRKLQPAS